MLAERPELFIGVDSSDFNLGLERQLKEAGIPTMHYVSPSVWAWRGWRVHRIARAVTHMLVMFPFEAALYAKAGVPVTYVGHPLADMIPRSRTRPRRARSCACRRGKLIVALLPGSRRSELQYMADQLRARRAPLAARTCPTCISSAGRDARDARHVRAALRRHERTDLPLTLLFGHSHEALAAADMALVASGTATLEAALFKTPMVITYRQSPLSWHLMRRMRTCRTSACRTSSPARTLVPELLQDEATPAALGAALLDLLRDAERSAASRERFREIPRQLLRQNTAQKAADAVLRVLERHAMAAA